MAELLGALQLPPGTTQAGIFANGLRIGKTPLTDDFLSEHKVEVMVIGDTDDEGPDLFKMALHSIWIDGEEVYRFGE